MDTEQLVEQVVALVRKKLDAENFAPKCTPVPSSKPALILYEHAQTGSHCGSCTVCSSEDCPEDTDCYQVIVLGTLSCKNLFDIANGLGGNAFTRTTVKAFLHGQKVLIVKEGVELLHYSHCAPQLYYKNLSKNLEVLLGSGAVLVPTEKLCDTISTLCSNCGKVQDGAILAHTRKMLSLQDVKDAVSTGYSAIHLEGRAIVSNLAVEYAKEAGINLIRTESR